MSIIILNKLLGETPLDALRRFKKEHLECADEIMTYAGRLDPMAEGLLPVLSGEDRYRSKEFQGLDKTYQVTFLLGFTSDTGDMLGRGVWGVGHGVWGVREAGPSGTEVLEAVHGLVGEHTLSLPVYSAYKVRGKPLHMLAREGTLQEDEIPRRVMCVSSARVGEIVSMTSEDLLRNIQEKISHVHGDFRQEEILEQWKKIVGNQPSYTLVSCELDVTSGTYIRALADVLGARLGCGAVVYRLVRTRVGSFVSQTG